MRRPTPRRPLVLLTAAALLVLFAGPAFAWNPADLVLPPGDVTDAIRAAAQASAENPGDPERLARLGWLKHFYLNENDEAERLLAEALRSRPDPVSLFALAQIHHLRGDIAGSLRFCLEICRRFPDDPLAVWASAELSESISEYGAGAGEAAPVLHGLLSEHRVRNAVTARNISQALLSIARNTDVPLKEEEVAFSGGYLTGWIIVGPFGKFRNLSYRESFPPETESAIKKSYRSRSGAVHPVFLQFPEGTVRIPDFLERVGAFYAAAVIESPREQDVRIDLFSEAPHKLFLNGRLILESESFARFLPSDRNVKTRLARGRNCLMVKLCGGPGEQPFFFASVTSPESGLRADFRELSGLALPLRVPRDRQTPPVESEEPCYEILREAMRREPENPFVLYMLAMVEKGRGNYAEARGLIDAAAKVHPGYAPLSFDTADILLSALSTGDLSFERTLALSREAFERCLELAPDALEAKRGLAALEIVARREVVGAQLLNECLEKMPESPRFLSSLYRTYSDLGWEPEAYETMKKLLSVSEPDCRMMARAYGYFEDRGFFQELPAIEQRLAGCPKHRGLLVDIYLRSGRESEAADLLLSLVREQPRNLALRRTLFTLLLKLDRFEEAQKVLQEIAGLTAGLDSVEARAADLAFGRGSEAEGLKLLEKAYERFPGDAELERSLFLLKGRHVFDPFILDGLKCIENAPPEDAYADSSSYMLLDQLLVRINRDGSGEFRVHQIARVRDKEGIEVEGEVNIPAGAEIFALRTVKKDGTILEPETIPGKETVSMPGLQEGDFVEVDYSMHQSNLDEIPGGYNNDMVFAFQTPNRPLHYSELVVYKPSGMHLNLFEKNFTGPRPEVRKIEGYEVRRWVVRRSPAAVSEPNMGAGLESLPYIRVSYNVSWEDVSQYFENRIVEKLRPNRELQETVRRLSEGKATDADKVKSFLEFLSSAVARTESDLYEGRATEILASGTGSRLVLFLAMLKEAGIPFTVLQTRPFPARDTALESPNVNTFPIPLVSVALREGGTAWVDPSLDYPIYNYFSGTLHGSDAIAVYPHRRDLFVNLPPSTEEEERMETDVTIDVGKDRSVAAGLRVLFPGASADAFRAAFSSARPEEKDLFFQTLAGHYFPGASDINGESANLEDTGKPFEIRIQCRAADYLGPSGEVPFKRVGMVPLKLTTSYATLPERKFPLFLWPLLSSVTDVTIRLPEGLAFGTLPAGKRLEGEFGRYVLEVSENPSRSEIRLRRTAVVPSRKIEPSLYPSFRVFCDSIAEAENQSIIFPH
jgi:tetratricopeptide (TPR) repeat protein